MTLSSFIRIMGLYDLWSHHSGTFSKIILERTIYDESADFEEGFENKRNVTKKMNAAESNGFWEEKLFRKYGNWDVAYVSYQNENDSLGPVMVIHIDRHYPRKRELWRHFKGIVVEILESPVTNTETGEVCVAYCEVQNGVTWVRPLKMFMSEVDLGKHPDSKQAFRFEKVLDGEYLG